MILSGNKNHLKNSHTDTGSVRRSIGDRHPLEVGADGLSLNAHAES
jgi:hypothetical protein